MDALDQRHEPRFGIRRNAIADSSGHRDGDLVYGIQSLTRAITPIALMLVLAGCGASSHNAGTATEPHKVLARSIGPDVRIDPRYASRVSQMSDGREQVVLPDRIVIVQSEEHPGSSDSFRSIELRVSVESLGPAITNDRTLFALTTTDGDMFDAISMSPGFEGTISPHETRRGVITFKIPSGVQPQLFYGPARDGEHIGVPLHLGNAS